MSEQSDKPKEQIEGVKFEHEGEDTGPVYSAICPTCHETITASTDGQWWDTECRCRRWTLRVFFEEED